jgi:hypothetical protein
MTRFGWWWRIWGRCKARGLHLLLKEAASSGVVAVAWGYPRQAGGYMQMLASLAWGQRLH